MDYRKNLWTDRISEMLRKTEVNLLRLNNPYCEETWKYVNSHQVREAIQTPKSSSHQKQFIREESEEHLNQFREDLEKGFQDLEKMIILRFGKNREELQSNSDRIGTIEIGLVQTEKNIEMVVKEIKEIDRRFKINLDELNREFSEKVEIDEFQRITEEINRSHIEKLRSIKNEVEVLKSKESSQKEEFLQEFETLFQEFQKKFILKIELPRLKESFLLRENPEEDYEKQTEQKLSKLKKNLENTSASLNETLNDQDSKLSQFSDNFNKKITEVQFKFAKFKEIEAEEQEKIMEELEKITNMADKTELEKRLEKAEKTLKNLPKSQHFDSSVFLEREKIILLQNRFEETLREKKILMKKIEYLEEKVFNVEESRKKPKRNAKLRVETAEWIEIASAGKEIDQNLKKKKRKFSIETQFIDIPKARKPELSMKTYSLRVSKPRKHRLSVETFPILARKQKKTKLSLKITSNILIKPTKAKLSIYKTSSLLVSKPVIRQLSTETYSLPFIQELKKITQENLLVPKPKPQTNKEEPKHQDPVSVEFGIFPIQELTKNKKPEIKENSNFLPNFGNQKNSFVENLGEKPENKKIENDKTFHPEEENIQKGSKKLKEELFDDSIIELNPIKAEGIPRPKKYQKNLNKNQDIIEKVPEDSNKFPEIKKNQIIEDYFELHILNEEIRYCCEIALVIKNNKSKTSEDERSFHDSHSSSINQKGENLNSYPHPAERESRETSGILFQPDTNKISEAKPSNKNDELYSSDVELDSIDSVSKEDQVYSSEENLRKGQRKITKSQIKDLIDDNSSSSSQKIQRKNPVPVVESIDIFAKDSQIALKPGNFTINKQKLTESDKKKLLDDFSSESSSDSQGPNSELPGIQLESIGIFSQKLQTAPKTENLLISKQRLTDSERKVLLDESSSSESNSYSQDPDKKLPGIEPETIDFFSRTPQMASNPENVLKDQQKLTKYEKKSLLDDSSSESSSDLQDSHRKKLILENESQDIFAKVPQTTENYLKDKRKLTETDKKIINFDNSSDSSSSSQKIQRKNPVPVVESIDIFAKDSQIALKPGNFTINKQKLTESDKKKLLDDFSSESSSDSQGPNSELPGIQLESIEIFSQKLQTAPKTENLLISKQRLTDSERKVLLDESSSSESNSYSQDPDKKLPGIEPETIDFFSRTPQMASNPENVLKDQQILTKYEKKCLLDDSSSESSDQGPKSDFLNSKPKTAENFSKLSQISLNNKNPSTDQPKQTETKKKKWKKSSDSSSDPRYDLNLPNLDSSSSNSSSNEVKPINLKSKHEPRILLSSESSSENEDPEKFRRGLKPEKSYSDNSSGSDSSEFKKDLAVQNSKMTKEKSKQADLNESNSEEKSFHSDSSQSRKEQRNFYSSFSSSNSDSAGNDSDNSSESSGLYDQNESASSIEENESSMVSSGLFK